MLPSTGLFKKFKCPFFDCNEENAKTSCPRPFCHFKHARKDAEPQKTEKPQYSATPMNLEERPIEVPKKKPKLEYIPLPAVKSRIEYNPSSAEDAVTTEIPEDIQEAPKNVENKENIESKDKENISEKTEEMEVDEIKEEEKKPEEAETKSKTPRSSSSSSSSRHKHKSSHHSSHRSSSSTHKSSSSSSSSKTSSTHKSSHHKSSHKEEERKSKHKEDRSERKKDTKSTESKEKSSRSNSKEKEKTSRSNSKEKEKSRSNSKEKSVRDEKHSSKESSRSKEKSKSDDDRKKHDRHKSTGTKEKSSRSDDRKSSSRSKEKSSKDRRSSKDEKTSTKLKEELKKKEVEDKRAELSPSPELLISDLESDEDDVLEQCKAIFEEYTPDTNGKSSDELKEKNTEPESISTDEEPVDCSKKRVARDGAVKPLLRPTQRNLKLNPMQQIYKRQEAMRKIAEATSPANLPPIKARPNIAPVSNMLAMKYAKAKIDALKKSQHKPIEPAPSTSKTTAQTASKFYGRTAHITRAPDPDTKPAPPVLEPASTKISYNVRMQYYNMMVKHCLVIYPNCEDAFNRAQIEELAAMKKCTTVNIYKSSALLTVNKLRKEAIDSGNTSDEKKTISHDLIIAGKQSTSWSVNKKLKTEKSQVIGNFDIMPGEKAYKLVAECLANEEQLRLYGYPRGTPGMVKIHSTKRPLPPNKDERYCCRCSKIFNPEIYDEIHIDECNYHPKSAGFKRGSADNFHYCCQQPAGTAGCMYSNYHVTDWLDYDNLKGFVRTLQKDDEDFVPTKRDIFAFDCEMCYTRGGFELTRITVVNFEEKVVYDTLVRPDNEVVDYNTTYSGITEELLSKVKTSIREVQAVLLSMFHADTILIGHSLESDMKAVKLLHDKVVDTAMLFPHKMGFPKKRALKTLCVENLKRIIQENDGGHDSSEDAIACIQLVKHYLRNRIV